MSSGSILTMGLSHDQRAEQQVCPLWHSLTSCSVQEAHVELWVEGVLCHIYILLQHAFIFYAHIV